MKKWYLYRMREAKGICFGPKRLAMRTINWLLNSNRLKINDNVVYTLGDTDRTLY